MSDPDPIRALKRYRARIELPLEGPVEAAMTESALGEWVRFDELASVLAVLPQPQKYDLVSRAAVLGIINQREGEALGWIGSLSARMLREAVCDLAGAPPRPGGADQ